MLLSALLCIFGAAFAADEENIDGGYSTIRREDFETLKTTLSSKFDLLKSQNADFDYVLKSIVSGRSQAVAGSHSIVKVLAAPKDHADQDKHCDVDFYEDLRNQISEVTMICAGNDKTFVYKHTH